MAFMPTRWLTRRSVQVTAVITIVAALGGGLSIWFPFVSGGFTRNSHPPERCSERAPPDDVRP